MVSHTDIVPDSEKQGHHTVAADSVPFHKYHIVGTFGIGFAMPNETAAGGHLFYPFGTMQYGKMQRHHTVAAHSILFHIHRLIGVGSISIAMPGVAVAHTHLLHAC